MSHRAVIPALVAFAALGSGGGCIVEEVSVVETVIADYYEPCVFDQDCPRYARCRDIEIDYGFVVVGDAMCTTACRSDFDCPLGGICLRASYGPPLCYQPCLYDFDCPPGFGCVQDTASLTFDPACMPI